MEIELVECGGCGQLFPLDEMGGGGDMGWRCNDCFNAYFEARACYVNCRVCGRRFEVDMVPVTDDPYTTCCTPAQRQEFLDTGGATCDDCILKTLESL